MKRKIYLLASILCGTSTMVACNNSASTEMIDNNYIASEILGKLEDMVFKDNASRYDILNYVNDNISKINNLDISSFMLNTFIYTLYENLELYSGIINSLSQDLEAIESLLKVESVSVSLSNKIPTEYEMLKATLGELDNFYLNLTKTNDYYSVYVDMKKIVKEYEKYMNNDTKNYINFRIKEAEKEIYNMNSDEYDIDALFEMASDIYAGIESVEGVSQLENWIEHLRYYYELIFSLNHEKFVDENSKITDSVLLKMKEGILKYESTEFGEVLNGYISVLEKNDFNVESEKVSEYINEVLKGLNSKLEELNTNLIEEE